jgi:fumarate hydratase, class II
VKRWGKQTELAIENFSVSGEQMAVEILDALACIKEHVALANGAHGVIPESVGRAVAQAAAEARHGSFVDQFPVDVFQTGSGTSTNMNMNEVLAHRASEILGSPVSPIDHVNASQSSNDVFPSALRIAALVVLQQQVVPSLQALASELETLSALHQGSVKAGRTHLMDAAPMTFGQEAGGWARSIRLGIDRLSAVLPRLYEMPLGGTAVGTGLNAPKGFAAEVISAISGDLGFPLCEAVDHFEAQSAQDVLLELSGALRVVVLSMCKLAGDLRLLSSGPETGLGELTLRELQAGSSIMPGKVNPVIPEVVQQVAAQVVGNDAAIAFACGIGSALQLNTAMPIIGRNLLQSLRLVGGAAASLAEKCISVLTVNVEVMHDYAGRSPAIAAALNPTIGYEAAAAIVRQAVQQGLPVVEVARASGTVPPELLQLLDPLRLARWNDETLPS